MSIGLINAQNCLGKNKVQAKKEVYSKLAPKIFTPIKSFGYDGYSYSSNFRDSFFLFFNSSAKSPYTIGHSIHSVKSKYAELIV